MASANLCYPPCTESVNYLFENDEHAALRAQVRRWAATEIAPYATAWEEAEEFPLGLYARAAEAGVLGVGYPVALGGAGGDLSHAVVASEELVVAGHSVGTTVGLGSHGIALPPIVRSGTPEQIDRWVRPVLRGEKVSALAVTEPGGGSDVAGIRTRAVLDGGCWVVNGAKTFITSGVRADVVVVAVRTGGSGHGGLSLLGIDRGTPGFTVGKKLRKMGWWASDTAELHFDDCRVPVGNLIGEAGQGFIAIVQNFVTERVYLAAQCVAIARLAYETSVAYARERMAFGRTLTGFQVVRHKLAEMAARIAAARALTGEVVERSRRGESVISLAALAKNIATDACSAVCDQAVQIHGGHGYMRESLVERLYRDARLYAIGGGTREIMNEIVCKAEGY